MLSIFLPINGSLAQNQLLQHQQQLLIDVHAVASDHHSSIIQDFRKPRSVVFCAMMGGSSHVNWVLATLQELNNRGHSTTFIARDDHIMFGKKYPAINGISVGSPYFPKEEMNTVMKELRSKPPIKAYVELLEGIGRYFVEDYLALLKIFEVNKFDLVICDHFTLVCNEVAIKLGLPFVVTSSIPYGDDASAPYVNNHILSQEHPTTLKLSLWQRINDLFIKPLQFLYYQRHYIRERGKLMTALGLEPSWKPEAKWADALKVFNTGFGFTPPRPMSPLVELVGPIVTNIQSKLTPELEDFLQRHQKVAYVAFGQTAVCVKKDIQLILTGLLEAYEAKEIDGIIWSTRNLKDEFPDFITLQGSNTTYDIRAILSASSSLTTTTISSSNKESNTHSKDFRFLNWLPQMAILRHASTAIFVTHGGSNSISEAMYAGTRIVVYPFFGDQPGNARTAEKNGIGLRVSAKEHSLEQAIGIIRRVARDDRGYFQANVDRMKVLVQLRSKHGVTKAADLAEEVMFMQIGGKLPHRRDVKRDMFWWKAYNVDIYSILVLSVMMIIWLVRGCFLYLQRSNYTNTKLKSL
ncbi:hypothetical protein BDF20DRAFT_914158 [Mycotypha africana]|uniref:uncharacterized protein n=1 Tax=Mycotypha africana TaxID=64632 RepID=UPI002300C317|nr:uncharacterized protein BDF20DRAFT_914158 [Mycotypha africana]KAI8975194.1 hypothetical protein BDF20DRAFT_914158 [Mycotypha africana]